MRKLIRLIAFTVLTSLLPIASFGQQPPITTPNPDRNFLGSWTGTIPVNPGHELSPVHLTISEMPGGSGMLWQYEFGAQGQKGHKTPSKAVLLRPREAMMLSQWNGYPQNPYTTAGLDEFARAGYGSFTASHSYDRSGYFFSKKHITDQVTFELQPATMSYLWEQTTDGKTKVFSHFLFHRDIAPNQTSSHKY